MKRLCQSLRTYVFRVSRRVVFQNDIGSLPYEWPTAMRRSAAETFAMHRMMLIKSISNLIHNTAARLACGAFLLATLPVVHAQLPPVAHADADYAASGYLSPHGMASPKFNASTMMNPMMPSTMMPNPMQSNPVMQAGGMTMPGAAVAPVGYYGPPSCDTGPAMYGGGCDSACDSGCAPGCKCIACRVLGDGGLLGKLRGEDCGACGGGGCSTCAGGPDEPRSRLRFLCMFCRGDGCSACQCFGKGHLLGALHALAPYTDSGRCAQRWYDLSAEGLFLSRQAPGSIGVDGGVITQDGSGATGTPVISTNQIFDEGLRGGVRLSAAMIFGAGGNIEGTYIGGMNWKESTAASSPAVFDNSVPPNLVSGANLFSFITNFGTDAVPLDDVDNSVTQSIETTAKFHSAELNYRRRTVGPYCRFQGSWLFGMRYLRYDNGLGLDIVGLNNDGTGAPVPDADQRFFNSHESVKNSLFGAQLGGDIWYNLMPGVSLGFEAKGIWAKNEARRSTGFRANSINVGGFGSFYGSEREDDGTLACELQAKIVYRLSHSWSFRSAYYLIAIDEVATPTLDREFIKAAALNPSIQDTRSLSFDRVTLNGVSFGAEYIW